MKADFTFSAIDPLFVNRYTHTPHTHVAWQHQPAAETEQACQSGVNN